MTEINIALLEQTGGWFNVQLIPLHAVTNCPLILTNANASTFTFNVPETDIFEVLPVGENISITENQKKTTSGTYYDINANFLINHHQADLDNFLKKYINQKIILIAAKHYGQKKIYGSVTNPLQLSYNFQNGKQYQEGSNISVNVYGKLPQKPVFITT